MNAERYLELSRSEGKLTDEEWKEGWHYCPDWDYMLIGPEWQEKEACNCD